MTISGAGKIIGKGTWLLVHKSAHKFIAARIILFTHFTDGETDAQRCSGTLLPALRSLALFLVMSREVCR